jgi:hypothetical protein
MLGGYPTAEQNGMKLENRDAIRYKIDQFAEGHIFRESDLDLTPQEKSDFSSLRGYDYFHLSDGYFTKIVETSYLRKAPRIKLFLAAYQEKFDVSLRETGDRTAWSLGLKKWEPIRGYRFYTSGRQNLMAIGRMKIQFIPAPAWVLDPEYLSNEAISILDTYKDKESDKEIRELCRTHQYSKAAINAAKSDLLKLSVASPGNSEQQIDGSALDEDLRNIDWDFQAALRFVSDLMGDKSSE